MVSVLFSGLMTRTSFNFTATYKIELHRSVAGFPKRQTHPYESGAWEGLL